MSRLAGLAVAAALSCLAACSNNLEYAPPPQKAMPEGPAPLRDRPIVRMRDPDVDHFLLQDMLSYSVGQWRWTRQHPRFRIFVAGPKERQVYARFAIIDGIFRKTGPVTVSITVNGKPVAAPRYVAAGEYEFSQPVPELMLAEHSPAIVGFDIDPVFVGDNSDVLGVYLDAVGLPKSGSR